MHFSCATCYDEAKTCYVCHNLKEKSDINFDEFTAGLIKYEELFTERRDCVSVKLIKIYHKAIGELKKFDECLDTLEFCLNDIKTCKNLIENSKTFETHYIVHRILSNLQNLNASTLQVSKLDVNEINKQYRVEMFNDILKERMTMPDDGTLEVKLARQADRIPKLVAESHIKFSLEKAKTFIAKNTCGIDQSNFVLENLFVIDNIPFFYKALGFKKQMSCIFNKIDAFNNGMLHDKNDDRWLLFKKMFEV